MLKNQPAGSPTMTATTVRQPSRLRFSGLAAPVKSELVTDIKNMGAADKLYKGFGRIQSNPHVWGFSINDWASRLNTALAVYAPALYFSLVPEKKHFWETNGRNVLIWFTTLGVTILTKHPQIGVNAMLNHVMPQKKVLQKVGSETFGDKIGRWWQKGLNIARPKYDYYDMLQKAGVLTEKQTKEARNKKLNKWDLDNNQIEQLKMKMEQLSDALKTKKGSLEGLSKEEAEAFVKQAPKLINRLSNMKMAAVLANAAATVYIIGILAMDAVFKYIAPHDPDFDASKYAKFKKKSDHKSTAPNNENAANAAKPSDIQNGNLPQPVSFSPVLPPAQLPGLRPLPFPFQSNPIQSNLSGLRPFSLPYAPNPGLQGGHN